MTMGDAQTDSAKDVAARKVVPEIIGSLTLRLVGVGLMAYGIVERKPKQSVINSVSLSGAGLFTVSCLMGHDAANRYENQVALIPKPLTLKPHT